MRSTSSAEKTWFLLSLLVLSFAYGFGSHARGWFPKTYLEQAWQQALTLLPSETPTSFTGTPKYDRQGVRMPAPERMQPGLTLLSSAWRGTDGWHPELRLITREGQVLHKWRFNRDDLFQDAPTQRKADPSQAGVQGSYLFPNGDVLINLEYVGLVRLTACGAARWTLAEGNHHSIDRADDGSFWVPGVSATPQSQTTHYPEGVPGLRGKNVWVDRILHVSEDGDILEEIGVLDLLYENDLDHYLPKSLGGPWPDLEDVHPDITHLNDGESLDATMASAYPLFDAGDLLVSLRQLSLVFVVDPETRKIKWHASDPFVYQHDPDFIGEGWIGVFDNNYRFKNESMTGESRIVFLNPHTDSTTVPFPTTRSEPFYTDVMGKWQHLANGNMLLSETRAGRAVEVAPDGRTVWEWVHSPISSSKIPAITKASRHNLTRDEVASWPCSRIDSTSLTPASRSGR